MPLPISNSIQIKANGTDVSSSVDYSTVALNLVLTKEVSTLKFTVHGAVNVAGKYRPAVNDVIGFYETMSVGGSLVTTQVFGGTITEIEMVNASVGAGGGILIDSEVTAVDWGYTMDQKLVVNSFANMDPADIVAAIVPAGFDVTTYVQRAGYNITSIKFNYEQVTKCLQALANQIGWQWYVDANKAVHFFLAENNAAPITIDDTSGGIEYNTLDVDINLQNMKNSVFVIGGTYEKIILIANAVDVYLGNGTQTGFGLVYSYIASTIAILVGGVGQSVGILNQEINPAAFDVLYDPTGRTLSFNTVPPNNAAIIVFGTAEIPIIAHVLDQAKIALYGEFQDSIFDANILSVLEAQKRAQAEILQFGNPVYNVKFTTLTPGIRIGQNININSALYGISNYPLVVKNIQGAGRTGFQVEYTVQCIGSDVVSFVDLMSTLLQGDNANQSASGSSVLQAILILLEMLTSSDTLHAPTSKTTRNYVYGPSGGQVGVYNFSTYA